MVQFNMFSSLLIENVGSCLFAIWHTIVSDPPQYKNMRNINEQFLLTPVFGSNKWWTKTQFGFEHKTNQIILLKIIAYHDVYMGANQQYWCGVVWSLHPSRCKQSLEFACSSVWHDVKYLHHFTDSLSIKNSISSNLISVFFFSVYLCL